MLISRGDTADRERRLDNSRRSRRDAAEALADDESRARDSAHFEEMLGRIQEHLRRALAAADGASAYAAVDRAFAEPGLRHARAYHDGNCLPIPPRPTGNAGGRSFHCAVTSYSKSNPNVAEALAGRSVRGTAASHAAYIERDGAAERLSSKTPVREQPGGLDRERTAEENQAYLERVDTPDEPVVASFGNVGRTFKERSEFWIKLEQCEQKPGLHVVRTDRSRDPEFWTRVIAHQDAGKPIPEVVDEALHAVHPLTRKLSDQSALELIAFLREMGVNPRQSRRREPKAVVLSPARGGRVQTRIIAELPPELTPEQRVQVVKAFCAEFEQSMLPYWAVIHAPDRHNDDRNFHVHIALSERPAERVSDPKTGESCWDFEILVETRDKKRTRVLRRPYIKNKCAVLRGRDWPGIQRERWAKAVNDACSRAGLKLRFDPRTYEEQGIAQDPRPRLSTGVFARERKGEVTEKGLAAAQVQWRGRVRWAADVTLAVEERLTSLKDRLLGSPPLMSDHGPALLANVVSLGERIVRQTREVLAAEYVRERLISRLRLRRTSTLTLAEREVMDLARRMEADNAAYQARLHHLEQELARSVELAEAWLVGEPESLEVNVRSDPERVVSGPDQDPAGPAGTAPRGSSPQPDPQAVEDLGTEISGVGHRAELSGSNSPTQQGDGGLGQGWSDHSSTPLALRGLLDRVARGENLSKSAGPEPGGLGTLTDLSEAVGSAGQVLNILPFGSAAATGALAQSGEDLASGLTNQEAEVPTVDLLADEQGPTAIVARPPDKQLAGRTQPLIEPERVPTEEDGRAALRPDSMGFGMLLAPVGSGKPSATFASPLGWAVRVQTPFAPFRVEVARRGPSMAGAPEDQPKSECATEDGPVLTDFSSEPHRDLGTATRDKPDRNRGGAHDQPASPGGERKERAASDLATTSAKAQPPKREQDFSKSSRCDAPTGATGSTTACSEASPAREMGLDLPVSKDAERPELDRGEHRPTNLNHSAPTDGPEQTRTSPGHAQNDVILASSSSPDTAELASGSAELSSNTSTSVKGEVAKVSQSATSVTAVANRQGAAARAAFAESISKERAKARVEEDEDAAFHRNGKAGPADLRRYKVPGMFETWSKRRDIPQRVIDPRAHSVELQLAVCEYLDADERREPVGKQSAREKVLECAAAFSCSGLPQWFAEWAAEFPTQAAKWRSDRREITRLAQEAESASEVVRAEPSTTGDPSQATASDRPPFAADLAAAGLAFERAVPTEGQAQIRKQIDASIESWREPRRRSIATFLSAIHEENLPLRNAAARLSNLDSDHLRFLNTWSQEDPVGAELLVRRFQPLTLQEVLRELRSRGIGE